MIAIDSPQALRCIFIHMDEAFFMPPAELLKKPSLAQFVGGNAQMEGMQNEIHIQTIHKIVFSPATCLLKNRQRNKHPRGNEQRRRLISLLHFLIIHARAE